MASFAIIAVASFALIVASALLFYEVLGGVWAWLPKLNHRPKMQLLVTMFTTFFCHTGSIWLFGVAYYFLAKHSGFGALEGNHSAHFMDYIYFSGVTYSTIGFGDVYLSGDLRMLAAVEAIVGLTLIGWTIAFSYVFAERYLMRRHDPRRPLP